VDRLLAIEGEEFHGYFFEALESSRIRQNTEENRQYIGNPELSNSTLSG
jgi:hypothetical protein